MTDRSGIVSKRFVIALCVAGFGVFFAACDRHLMGAADTPHREATSSPDRPASAVQLPAEFRHNRLFLRPVTLDGDQIEFYTDTGGGWNALRRSDSARLGLKPGVSVQGGNRTYQTVVFPTFDPLHSIPAPSADYWLGGQLALVNDEEISSEGFLGGRWFADKVWEIDYLTLLFFLLEEATRWPGASSVDLAFQTNADGKRTMHFPRLTIHVDGEPLEVLLDTGATAKLSNAAASHFGISGDTRIGTSYIVQSIFNQWSEKHPDWLVIRNADIVTGHAFPMIRVPEILIGGVSTGPVWFTARPDHTFEVMMSRMMDKPIAGAIGGSAFENCRLVLDYPSARMLVSCDQR